MIDKHDNMRKLYTVFVYAESPFNPIGVQRIEYILI